MKSHRKLAVVVSVLLPLLLVCTSLSAGEKTKRAIWGEASNDGNVDVILHVKMEGGRYTDLILPVDGMIILPKGTVKVKVVPMGPLRGISRLRVDIRPSHSSPLKYWPRITEPGKSRTFSTPTDAIPLSYRRQLGSHVIVPPGAVESGPEPKKQPEQVSKADRKSRLLELNDLYMKYSRRLAEVESGSEEAKRIREALEKYGRDIDRYIAGEEAEHGPGWIEAFRNKQTRKLPGGLIEDGESKLVKLKEERDEQKEKTAELEKDFERLKKEEPVPDWNKYLQQQRDKLKEEFVKLYGPSSEWDKKKGNIREEYQKKHNELADKAKEDWEKAKKAESENNRQLGKTIKQLAEEKAKLKEQEQEIEQLEEEVSEEEAKKRQARKISDLDGRWRGNDFGWSSVTIDNGKGTSSFGRFEVEKKELVVYYDFEPEFSQSVHKGDRRYQHEYEFSGTWSRPEWSWSGLIGLHIYSDKVIHVIFETPKGYLSSGSFLREGPPPAEKEQSQEKSSAEER